jgi:hypothetical protein
LKGNYEVKLLSVRTPYRYKQKRSKILFLSIMVFCNTKVECYAVPNAIKIYGAAGTPGRVPERST